MQARARFFSKSAIFYTKTQNFQFAIFNFQLLSLSLQRILDN